MSNSLAEVHPELVSEWSEKNLPLTPDDITFGSNKKVWWKGACGHEWKTSVKARSNGEKCPICSGVRVIAGINDLATLEPLLVKQWSKKNKIKPTEVSIGSHKKVIWRCEKGHEWEAAVKSRTINKTDCPYCSHNKVLAGFNDLATLQPDIAAEWSDRNYPLLPTQVTVFANRKVWWKCKDCGKEWNTLISTRSGGSKCPYCSGYIFLKGFNDLQTTHPEIASEWSEKNLPLKPDEVNAKSRKNVWWRCGKCGNEWKSVINARVKGTVYELVSGHRRKRACELAGFETLRSEIIDLSRDEATILMVESNFQRSEILPSEKAFAYKMRLEALSRQGKRTDLTSNPLGRKSDGRETAQIIGEQSGDSQTQVRRYIRLTNLVPELLEFVDEGRIKMRPAVELSYLDEDCQRDVVDEIDLNDATPSHDQTIRMRKLFNEGNLTTEAIHAVMSEEKPNQKEKIVLRGDRVRQLNVIFVGRDADGIPRYAHCRGTGEIKYRGDVTGSDKSYGFSYRGTDNQLFVFEAAINMLSFIQLFPKDWKKRSYLSLGGVSSVALMTFLSERPQITSVFLCLDNDQAGNEACEKLAGEISEGYSVIRLKPSKKDWNEILCDKNADRKKAIAETITIKVPESEERVPMLCYEDIEQTSVEWLWFPYIPFGKLTIIQGNPGE